MTAALMPVAAGASDSAKAEVQVRHGRAVVHVGLGGGRRAGAIGPREATVAVRAVEHACAAGLPIALSLATSGADIHGGVASLDAWGRLAKALSAASGVVPIIAGVSGPCLSGPALLLGLCDHVVMADDAFAYVSGPEAVRSMTAVDIGHAQLGGAPVHAARTGVASLVVAPEDVPGAVDELLGYLPANHLEEPPRAAGSRDHGESADWDCVHAAAAVPADPKQGYDVREVIDDVADAGSVCEVRAAWAPNIVTAYARLGGRPVGIVANQPLVRAGTIDIAAASKAGRFVQSCDAFNLAIVTFVDTPGFEPGRDLEWRGMIRHGAELVYAYGAASVPRICVIVRKAYGGAYIVMDSRTLGNDACFAWAGAEIAVMGAPGAVAILHGKELASINSDEARDATRRRLECEYQCAHTTPAAAAARGLVDDVIDPRHTRRAVMGALAALATKREHARRAKHGNTPL